MPQDAPQRKRRSAKKGLPPGTLIHIGTARDAQARIRLLSYNGDSFEERDVENAAQCAVYLQGQGVKWTDLEGIHDVGLLEAMGSCYGLHGLVMEDILNTEQRPKIEDYTDYLYIVLKMISLRPADREIQTEQISLVLGKDSLLSFQEGIEGDVFGPARDRIRNNKGRIRKAGADFLAYSLIDAVVDNYFGVLEHIGERIEDLEDRVVTDSSTRTLAEIHAIKRALVTVRKSVWPLREVLGFLERGDSPLVQDATRIYLRDAYDHTVQVIDTVETYRDMVSGMLDIYLSSVSNRLNQIMKVLTLFATIFMPLTFIVGIYGMNFKHMPELDWQYGYYAIWGVMLAVACGMIVYFRKKEWM